MSYDLLFRSRDSSSVVTTDQLVKYFRSRAFFRVEKNQAWYSNETTGVYFVFELGTSPEIEDPDEQDPMPVADFAPVSFNLNYFRPHFFGLEAEVELTLFVKAFDLLVSDPQSHGMGDGEYTPEGFLRGWNAGNRFGYEAILTQKEYDGVNFLSLPTPVLESLWRWNFTRDARHEERGDEVYIPRIFFFSYQGALCTGVAWGDAMPILLPKVDILVVPRKELAPRRFFKKTDDVVVIEWREVEHLVSGFKVVHDALPAHALAYSSPPDDLVKLIRSKKVSPTKPQGVAPDQVLNQELIAAIRGRQQ